MSFFTTIAEDPVTNITDMVFFVMKDEKKFKRLTNNFATKDE
jgi:hypothetical protein